MKVQMIKNLETKINFYTIIHYIYIYDLLQALSKSVDLLWTKTLQKQRFVGWLHISSYFEVLPGKLHITSTVSGFTFQRVLVKD
jgi:hypothetical protein